MNQGSRIFEKVHHMFFNLVMDGMGEKLFRERAALAPQSVEPGTDLDVKLGLYLVPSELEFLQLKFVVSLRLLPKEIPLPLRKPPREAEGHPRSDCDDPSANRFPRHNTVNINPGGVRRQETL
jgi:hypothetical protein